MVPVFLALLLLLSSRPATAGSSDLLQSTTAPSAADDADDDAPAPDPFSPSTYAPAPSNSPGSSGHRSAAGKLCASAGCVNLPKLPAPDFKALPQGPQRRTAFLNYFGPQAVMLQKATGYPASLMLAQWAQESGWGSSDNYIAFNNIAGHRCWKNGQIETIKVRIPGRVRNVRRVCQLKEGSTILYWKFENVLDATLAYLDNLLYCEDTAKAYQSIRAEVARAKDQGVQWQKLMPGLSEYCPWDSYQIEVPQVLRQNRVESWEKKNVCSCS